MDNKILSQSQSDENPLMARFKPKAYTKLIARSNMAYNENGGKDCLEGVFEVLYWKGESSKNFLLVLMKNEV